MSVINYSGVSYRSCTIYIVLCVRELRRHLHFEWEKCLGNRVALVFAAEWKALFGIVGGEEWTMMTRVRRTVATATSCNAQWQLSRSRRRLVARSLLTEQRSSLWAATNAAKSSSDSTWAPILLAMCLMMSASTTSSLAMDAVPSKFRPSASSCNCPTVHRRNWMCCFGRWMPKWRWCIADWITSARRWVLANVFWADCPAYSRNSVPSV